MKNKDLFRFLVGNNFSKFCCSCFIFVPFLILSMISPIYAGTLEFDGVAVDITTNDGDDLVIVPGEGGNTQIGNAGGTNSNASANDDLHITGKLEVDGLSYFDDALSVMGNLKPRSDASYSLGDQDLSWGDLYVKNVVGPTVFNEDGEDKDVRFEGVGATNLLFIDASVARVGIGTSGPASLFSVGSGNEFQVSSTGDLAKIKNIDYAWPDAQGGVDTILTNNGSGVLSWESMAAAAGNIEKAIGTAKGDLIAFSASATPVRLGIGADNEVLIADSAQASGMKWGSLSGVYEPAVAAGLNTQYYRGDKTWQTLNAAAVGLGDVENAALSTWAGSGNITTVGTVTSGDVSAIEADPVVKAINGLVKSNGTVISAAVAGTDYVASESDPVVKAISGLVKSDGNAISAAVAGTDYEAAVAAGTNVQYYRGDKSWQTLDKAAVGLSNVENTALSTWTGSTAITTLGTIGTGTWNGTAIAVANGGTGAATAAAARQNLDVEIGVDVQAWDADLDTWAGKTAPTGAVVGTTDTQTLTNKTIDASLNTLSNVALTSAVTGILPVANGGTGTNTGSITGTGALTFTAGGSNQNVTLTPSGTGYTVLNGNVGIGTTSAGAKVDVKPVVTADADYTGLKTGLEYNGGTMTNAYGMYVAAPSGSGTITNKYAIVTEANAGKVGIGTTEPSQMLEVAGIVEATGMTIGGNAVCQKNGTNCPAGTTDTNANTECAGATTYLNGEGACVDIGSVYEPVVTAGTNAQYYRGDKTWQTLNATAVGLGNVENTALSTWTGSTAITTLGTIGTGTWNGTAIAVANGGTGAATAAAARQNLDVEIGVDVQAWDADLDTWAGKTAPAGAIVGTTDVQTLTNKTIDASLNTLSNVALTSAVTGILPVANGGTGTNTGSITGTGALTFTAGGSNQNVTLTPSGTGYTVLNGNVGIGTTSPAGALQVAGATGVVIGEDKTAGSANTAGVIKVFSAGDNAFYSTFTAGTQTANATYTLPTASSNGVLKNTGGVLSWDSASYITDGNTNWDNSYGFMTASSTDTLTNKSGNISMWTNNSGYITDDTSVPKNHLANSGSLGFTWSDAEVSDTLTASYATSAGNADTVDGYHMNQDVQTTANVTFNTLHSTVNDSWFPYTGNNYNYIRGTTYAFNSTWYDETNAGYYVDPSATSIYNDLRANIFYDFGNTAYYVDPASTSNMNAATFVGNVTMGASANFYRGAHSSGYMVGSYNSVGANDTKTNPIYVIGSSYMPSDAALGSMYGIGYSHSNFWGAGKSTGWGLYTAENGAVHNTISEGGIWTAGTITAAGNVTGPGFFYSSDRRLKENIAPISSALDKILKLEGVSFDWKKDGVHSLGLIAQDVEKVFPELVDTNGTTGMKSVQYGNLVAPLIEAMKEQQKVIESQNVRLAELEKRLGQLEKK